MSLARGVLGGSGDASDTASGGSGVLSVADGMLPGVALVSLPFAAAATVARGERSSSSRGNWATPQLFIVFGQFQCAILSAFNSV